MRDAHDVGGGEAALAQPADGGGAVVLRPLFHGDLVAAQPLRPGRADAAIVIRQRRNAGVGEEVGEVAVAPLLDPGAGMQHGELARRTSHRCRINETAELAAVGGAKPHG